MNEIFGKFGKLRRVEVVIDRRRNNLPLGEAYVEYDKMADADKAIEYMDGVRPYLILLHFFHCFLLIYTEGNYALSCLYSPIS